MLGQYLGAGSATTKLLLHLNGNSTDSSGNGNNGSDSNITYSQVNGKFGQGAGFNGVSSRINFPKNSNTYLYNNWTIIAWVKRNVTGINNSCIWQMGNCFFYVQQAGYYDGGGDRYVVNSLFNQNDTTNWHCYIWTKSSTTGQCFYQDGVLAGTQASTSNNSDGYYEVNMCFQGAPGANTSSNQNVDEFALLGGIMTPQQVAKYYTYTKGYYATL